jgi:AAA family ATP:ADP antiporter
MLRGLISVRPEERRGATAAFLTIFGVLAAHTLLETARDALFLARLPAARLPWVYLMIALLAVAISQVPGTRKRARRYDLSAFLGASALVTLLFWVLGTWQSPWELYALYVWTGLLGSLAVLQFYVVMGDLYTVTQAKRIYGLVGTGSLLGAVVGAGAGRVIAGMFSTPALVLASAVTLAATALGPALFLRGKSVAHTTRAGASFRQSLDILRGQPYVRGLAALVLVSTVALTLGDYVFKSAVARSVPTAELGSFFASVYAVLNLLALLAQVFLSGWLLRAFGLHQALWVLPVLVFMGAAGVALGGGLGAALLLKGADGTFRNSVHRTGTELLFVPLADGVRSRAKPFIDLLGQRGGQALASLLILSEVFLNRGDMVLAAAAAGLSLVWIFWTDDLRSHYLDLFRVALREGTVQPPPDLPALDLSSLETLFTALNSADDAEVKAAIDLLAEEGRVRLIPALILHHPARSVVIRALELFAGEGRTDFIPVADRLLGHVDPEIRAAALLARTKVSRDEGLLREVADDPSPLVRATALVGLVSAGSASDEDRRGVDAILAGGSEEARVALGRAIAAQPAPAFGSALLRLSDGPEESVQAQAALAMGRFQSPEFLPALLPLLALRDVRSAARDALLAYGEEGLAFLAEALEDQALPHELRRHLPRTIALFSPREAADVLQRHLSVETDGMVRFKMLRALNRLAADPGVVFDSDLVRRATEATVEAAFRLVDWRRVLEEGALADPKRATPGHELLVRLLRDKETHALERIFRLLALQFRDEDFRGIYFGLRNNDARVRSSSRELLENLVKPPLRLPLLALVDDAPDWDRLQRAAPFYSPRLVDYETLLARILDEPGESMRCIAIYHVGELGLVELKPRLLTFRPEETGFFLSRVVERTLALLSSPPEQALAHA